MKILFIIPRPNVGGLQTSSRSRINALRSKGIEAEVLFFSQGDGAYIFKDIPHFYVNNANQFKLIVSENNYDFISFIYSLKYINDLPEDFEGKVLYEVRGWSSSVIQGLNQALKSQSVDAVICIAKYLESRVKAKVKDKIPIFVDGNTVDPMFNSLRSTTSTKWTDCPKPLGKRKIIAFIGRVDNSKNWKEFVNICYFISLNYKIELWFICNPNNSKCLNQMLIKTTKLNLHTITRVISNVHNDKMPTVYSVINASGGYVLSTSLREGLGNGILEPMACGCPVVSSNVPGKNEIITHNYNGLLYETGNIKEAVKYIKCLMFNKKKRIKIIKNALKTIKSEYAQEKYVFRYLDILSKI